MLPEDWRLSKLLYNMFSVQSVEPVNILTTTNNTTAINLVAENMGFTFLQESGIRRTPYMDRLSFFTVGEPPLTCPMALVYKKNGFLSPAARTFMNLIKDYYRQFDRGSALTDRGPFLAFQANTFPPLRSRKALPSKAFRAFDPTRGGLPPLELPRPNLSGFISTQFF